MRGSVALLQKKATGKGENKRGKVKGKRGKTNIPYSFSQNFCLASAKSLRTTW
jgi:hypothetical protein